LSRALALCFSPLLDPPSPPLPFSSLSFSSTSYSIAPYPFLLFCGRGRRAGEGACVSGQRRWCARRAVAGAGAGGWASGGGGRGKNRTLLVCVVRDGNFHEIILNFYHLLYM
jgi:hypothetical protein